MVSTLKVEESNRKIRFSRSSKPGSLVGMATQDSLTLKAYNYSEEIMKIYET